MPNDHVAPGHHAAPHKPISQSVGEIVSSAVFKWIAGAVAVLTLMAITWGGYAGIQAMFDENNRLIVLEIQKARTDMAEMHHDDLGVRVRVLQARVEKMEAKAIAFPNDVEIALELNDAKHELAALKDQRRDVERKWLSLPSE